MIYYINIDIDRYRYKYIHICSQKDCILCSSSLGFEHFLCHESVLTSRYDINADPDYHKY